MDKFYKESPFLFDPIGMLYLVVFFLFWYSKYKDRHPDTDFRIVDILLVMGAYLYIIFVGFFK